MSQSPCFTAGNNVHSLQLVIISGYRMGPGSFGVVVPSIGQKIGRLRSDFVHVIIISRQPRRQNDFVVEVEPVSGVIEFIARQNPAHVRATLSRRRSGKFRTPVRHTHTHTHTNRHTHTQTQT